MMAGMIDPSRPYVVMGLLNTDSIAWAVGDLIERLGGQVIYTVQNERMKRLFFDRSDDLSPERRDALRIAFCDVTSDREVREFFGELDSVAGVLHSIAYANPKTCLGEELYTNAYEDLKSAFHISCASLATVAHYAQPRMTEGGSIVAMSFESRLAFPYYNWMGVNKAALEALVRALARRYGRELIRINAVSAGPLSTKAARAIPHYAHLARTWKKESPLPWDPEEDKIEVAYAVAFLLGPFSRRITGQTLYVDGGASVVGGDLLPHEKVLSIEELAHEHGLPLG